MAQSLSGAIRMFRTEVHGQDGMKRKRYGKKGQDLYIKVPVGTLIIDKETGLLMKDLCNDGDELVAAKGGRGGRGNVHYKSSIRQAPNFAEAGGFAKEREVILELKLIADVGLLGFPNVGKSTLLNCISGMKLAIVSHKPQTTRNNIRAIYNREDAQVIFVDTPGIHRPKSKLSEFMVDSSFRAAKGADVVALMVDGRFGKPANVEKQAVETARKLKKPLILIVNKADAVTKESLLPLIANYSSLADFAAIVPVSALKDDGVEELMNVIIGMLPSSPRYFPMEEVTDQSEREIAAELIREQILHYTNEEIPHGTAVEIDSFEEELKEDAIDSYDRSLIKIHASIVCERDSHKSILLGKNGQMIKRIGTAARENIEEMTDCKVFLDLHVKVRKDWKNRQVFLDEFGYKQKED